MSKEEQTSNIKASLQEQNLLNEQPLNLIESPKKTNKISLFSQKQNSKRKNNKGFPEPLSDFKSTSIISPNFKKNIKKDLSSKIIINDEKNVIEMNQQKEDNKIMENNPNKNNDNILINPTHKQVKVENDMNDEIQAKRKKDWKSWSSTEKELFYEAIANGANYCSLQKLFKNMNDKIGTKSSTKIRDYYYRALRNVNKLLKSIGCECVNRKNRDEVLLSLNCYGKMISSKLKDKNNADGLKNLKKHPRLFKKAALTLKKLITNKINFMKSKKKNVKITVKGNLYQKIKSTGKNSNSVKKESKLLNLNCSTIQKKIIDLEEYRKLPFKKFSIRIFPSNSDTYYKMIESLYSPRLELQVSYTRCLSSIIDFLKEKWSKVSKKYQSVNLFLIPINGLWVSTQGISFTSKDSKSFDIGDIFIGYGMPNTSIIYMQYSWANKIDTINNYINPSNCAQNLDFRSNNQNAINSNETDLGNSMFVNKASKSYSNIENINNNFENKSSNINADSEEEKEVKDNKSIIHLSLDYDAFDPLEYLNIYRQDKEGNIDEKKNSSDSELEENGLDINDEIYKNEGEIEENSYFGLDHYVKMREQKDKKVEKIVLANETVENIAPNNNASNLQVLDFSNYSLNNSKYNLNSNNFNYEANNLSNSLKTNKKPSENKDLLTTPTFNYEINNKSTNNCNNSNIKRIPFIKMSPNSKKKNMEDLSSSTFNNPEIIPQINLEEKQNDNKNIIRNLNNSSFSNKELINNNNTITAPPNKTDIYLSPNTKKISDKDLIGASGSKIYEKKFDDMGRFYFDETSNNVNNLIMTNFPPEKNYSLFQENENSILYKNINSNLLINDLFNSNYSQMNPYIRNNNVCLQNNNPNSLLKTPNIEILDSKFETNNNEIIKGKKTKRPRKTTPEKSKKKKLNESIKDEDSKKNDLAVADKKRKKSKSPLINKDVSNNETANNLLNEKVMHQNINISNSNPYIFNQNNFYNGYQRPVIPNYMSNQNYNYYQPNTNIGIPDPQNLFLNKEKNKGFVDRNYHLQRFQPQQMDPPQYMINYRYPYMVYPQAGPIYSQYPLLNKPGFIGKK